MTSPTDSILQILKEVREARVKEFDSYKLNLFIADYILNGEEPSYGEVARFQYKQDTNRIMQITEALEISVEAINAVNIGLENNIKFTPREIFLHNRMALQEINELLKGTK